VLAELSDEPDSMLTLALPHGISARERADLIDHYDGVVRELRGRGHRVRKHVRRYVDGEVLVFDLQYRTPPASVGLQLLATPTSISRSPN
jgi:hypothetical protein